MKFNQTNVATLRPPAGKADHIEWDDGMPRFAIRFRNGGPGSYMIQFSLHGKEARLGLGKVSQVKLAEAKIEAHAHFAKIAKGVNPATERAKLTAKAKASTSLGELIEPFLGFLERIPRAPSYVAENKRSLERYFKVLHPFAPNDITRAMVAAELTKITTEHGTIASRNSRSHLHKFFNWVIGEGLTEGGNPVAGTNKVTSTPRERVLSEQEIVTIWNSLGDDDYGVINKILMLIGARRDQIGRLNKRTELKLDDKLIDLPGKQGRSKNLQRFLIPLSRQVVALLQKHMDRHPDSDFVFGDNDDAGFSGWSKSKERLDKKISEQIDGEIEHWTLHDYRRTFDTVSNEKLKILPHVADACLNHKGEAKKGVKGTYNYAQYLDEKKDALQKWANYIEEVVTPKPKLRVVG